MPHLRLSGAAFLLLVAALLVMAQVASATTYSIKVQTNASSYDTGQTVEVTGAVTPATGNSTGVLIRVTNPSGLLVVANETAVNATSGAFQSDFVAGGSSSWASGTYTVNATWGAFGPPISALARFSFTVSTTTTTSTTTSTSTTTTSSSSTSTRSSSSTSTSTSSTTSSSRTTTSTTSSTVTSSSTVSSTTTSSSSALSQSTTSTSTTSTSSTTSSSSTASSTSASSSGTTDVLIGVAVVVVLAVVAFVVLRMRRH